MKQCSTCKLQKPITEFYKCNQNVDNLYHQCKKCKSEYDKRRHVDNPNYRKSKNLQNRYGISLEDRQKMTEDQNGKCAICDLELDNGKYTCVDHCHETGKVRKLLCRSCNILIGHSKENIGTLKNAIQYLINHQY